MRTHYLKNAEIWDIQSCPMDSYEWKNILAWRQQAFVHMYETHAYTWIWAASSIGSFTLNSAWNIVRTSCPIFDLADVVWFYCHSPKISYCTLGALHDRLLTTTRLKNFPIVDNDICVLCQDDIETI